MKETGDEDQIYISYHIIIITDSQGRSDRTWEVIGCRSQRNGKSQRYPWECLVECLADEQ